ncbi:tetratricopeptide repeat-containing sensor histidine kinase [Mucilaginibacter sp.]|uniref:tetratricopeptide repeat-containing sensor histidine kinase n=1 Tax=Mucilaginibacter sp. TaxID=1882438 RepID=UPI002617F368|nr:tetratricopeptide repeat-containing sensor histidine kinase [Mucilaginibacter sp.]MDB5127728.1 sasA 1 [Mucilaginibacter sp.]
MGKKPILCALLIMLCAVCDAQTENIRKLQQQLPFIHDSLRYVDALNRLGMLSYEENVDTTLFYTEKARAIADRLVYPRGMADAANNLGIVYDMKGNLQLAMRYYNDARIRYLALHDSANVVQTLINIAMVYQEMGNDQKAILHYKQAVDQGRQLRQDSIMSLVYYDYVLQYPDSIPKDSVQVYIDRARKIGLKYKDSRLLLAVDQLIARNYIKNNEQAKGIALLKQTLSKTLAYNLYYLSLDLLTNLGDFYAPTDSAMAVNYYLQGLEITRKKNYIIYTEHFTRILYNFYSAKNDNAAAFNYSKQLVALHDEQQKMSSNSGVDYIEYALKDQQLNSARTQSKYQMLFLFLAVLLCIMTFIIIIILWRSRKRSQKIAQALRVQFEQSESTMEALELMNKDYARVIKIVAHDLRNPIGAINTITAMLQPDETLTAETRELIELVQVSSKNCLELINELLETDLDQQQNLKKEKVNLNELLEQCTRLLSFMALDKDQEVILNSNAPDVIHADYEKLWRVMNNLIINAIKFSPTGSEIHIDAGQLNNEVVIAVTDTGMGIPANLQNKIFDPFTSARRQGTHNEQPIGLGLYISKQIIEAHHGKIWFESDAGKGTVFYVSLPMD